MRTTEETPQYEKVPRKARTSRRLADVTCWTRGCTFINRITKTIGVDRNDKDITVTEVFEIVRGITKYTGRTNRKDDSIIHNHGR